MMMEMFVFYPIACFIPRSEETKPSLSSQTTGNYSCCRASEKRIDQKYVCALSSSHTLRSSARTCSTFASCQKFQNMSVQGLHFCSAEGRERVMTAPFDISDSFCSRISHEVRTTLPTQFLSRGWKGKQILLREMKLHKFAKSAEFCVNRSNSYFYIPPHETSLSSLQSQDQVCAERSPDFCLAFAGPLKNIYQFE